jgi:hypothetical protein
MGEIGASPRMWETDQGKAYVARELGDISYLFCFNDKNAS